MFNNMSGINMLSYIIYTAYDEIRKLFPGFDVTLSI